MIKAVHIEDEPRNIELLASLIKTHCNDDVILVGNAKSVPDGIKLIQTERPQLVYLDIELNKGNAFDLLEKLKGQNFHVIFITAYNDYAVKAFRHNAIDYLLKPISIPELKEATAKAVERISQSKMNANILDTLRDLKLNTGVQKVGIHVNDGVVFVNADEIVKCEASGSYTIFYLTNKKTITTTKGLKEIEELLPFSNFVRVHNSWIVNTNYIKKYYRGKNSYAEMDDGSVVTISLRKKSGFLSFLKEPE